MAQIQDDEGTRVTIGYRGTPEQKDELSDVLTEEIRAPNRKARRTLSKVCEYVMGLGIDLYWARHELGGAMDALQDTEGWTRRRTLLEVLKRGLAAKGKK